MLLAFEHQYASEIQSSFESEHPSPLKGYGLGVSEAVLSLFLRP